MKTKTQVILGVVLGVGLAATASAQDKVAKGEQVYAAQKCTMCHSIGGKGNPKGPLDKVGAKNIPEADLRAWMTDPKSMTAKYKTERKPDMRAYPNLSKDDLDALVAYMQSLK